MAFADNLKKIREAKGLSQAELADLINVAQPSIANYERCKTLPTIVTAVDLAKALGTTCEELVKGEANEKIQASERK